MRYSARASSARRAVRRSCPSPGSSGCRPCSKPAPTTSRSRSSCTNAAWRRASAPSPPPNRAAPNPPPTASFTAQMSERSGDALVVFGITGDLARKMTFRSLYRLEKRKLLDCPVIGVAADEWDVVQLRERARSAIETAGETIDEDVFDRFAQRLSMVSGDFGDGKTYERVARAIEGKHTP